MVLCMKTTVELPDDLLVEAKKLAAELRVPLRRLVEEGLRARLARKGRPPAARRRIDFDAIAVPGGLPPGMDVSDRERMHDYLAGEER
jgi:hypothetical protein